MYKNSEYCIVIPSSSVVPNGISLLIPTEECLLTIEEFAKTYIAKGTPYKLIKYTDIPEDQTFRDAWEVDFSQPDGWGGL